MIYTFSILIDNNYIHRDAHPKNIMYKKTAKKTMKINNMIIPTFGYHWYLIDYGLIFHSKFKLNKYEKYAP